MDGICIALEVAPQAMKVAERGTIAHICLAVAVGPVYEVKIREHVDSTAVVLTPGMGDAVQMDKAGILEIADLFVCNKADHAGEAKLVRELLDIAEGRPIHETVATLGKGVVELLDALLED